MAGGGRRRSRRWGKEDPHRHGSPGRVGSREGEMKRESLRKRERKVAVGLAGLGRVAGSRGGTRRCQRMVRRWPELGRGEGEVRVRVQEKGTLNYTYIQNI